MVGQECVFYRVVGLADVGAVSRAVFIQVAICVDLNVVVFQVALLHVAERYYGKLEFLVGLVGNHSFYLEF